MFSNLLRCSDTRHPTYRSVRYNISTNAESLDRGVLSYAKKLEPFSTLLFIFNEHGASVAWQRKPIPCEVFNGYLNTPKDGSKISIFFN